MSTTSGRCGDVFSEDWAEFLATAGDFSGGYCHIYRSSIAVSIPLNPVLYVVIHYTR